MCPSKFWCVDKQWREAKRKRVVQEDGCYDNPESGFCWGRYLGFGPGRAAGSGGSGHRRPSHAALDATLGRKGFIELRRAKRGML